MCSFSQQEDAELLECDRKITKQKAKKLVEAGYKVTGFVLTKNDLTCERKIVELQAVRSLSNKEMWELMHPQKN